MVYVDQDKDISIREFGRCLSKVYDSTYDRGLVDGWIQEAARELRRDSFPTNNFNVMHLVMIRWGAWVIQNSPPDRTNGVSERALTTLTGETDLYNSSRSEVQHPSTSYP